MNKKTKKLLIISSIILIIAIIFFIVITKKSSKLENNIVSPVEQHEMNDEKIQKNKDAEQNLAKVIIYWKLNDEKSLDLLKILNKYYPAYSEKIYFLAVNLEDNATKAVAFLNSNNISIPTSTKSNLKTDEFDEKNIENYPACAFLNKNGTLLDFTSKELTSDSIEAYLDLISENY